MFPIARRRLLLCLLLLVVGAGCSSEQSREDAAAGNSGAVHVPLTAAELERFVAIVQKHSEKMIPEFTPPDENESLDMNGSAEQLVETYRGEVRRLFDAKRQGAIWERDDQWSQALASHKISAEQFAALVRRVSLAVMRVRLDARVDVDKLVVQARRQVEQAKRTIDDIDEDATQDRASDSDELRADAVERLGKAVALLEFAEMVKKVHPDSAAMVRKFSGKLKPLLPAHANDELLAELKELANPRVQKAKQANFDADEDSDDN